MFLCLSHNTISEFYLPFPLSLLFVCFHHFKSEASRGYPMLAGVIQRHLFLSSSGKSSSPLSHVDSSSPNILSPTQSHFSRFPIYLISLHLFISVLLFLSSLSYSFPYNIYISPSLSTLSSAQSPIYFVSLYIFYLI